jgi:hypothetical protein
LGPSIRDKCWKNCNFRAFPTTGKHYFLNFSALRGPSPILFVHYQEFLWNSNMLLYTNR